jgi:hypothetical protein
MAGLDREVAYRLHFDPAAFRWEVQELGMPTRPPQTRPASQRDGTPGTDASGASDAPSGRNPACLPGSEQGR